VLLLDASVWAALAAPRERFHAEADAIVDSASALGALDLCFFEVANVVGVKMGKPERAKGIYRLIASRCRDSLVRVDADLTDLALRIAIEHGITAYDAAYVAAARRNGWTLVSADIRDLVSRGLAVAPDAADYP
jgi:predicted nucleic acid-binding protein